MTIFEPFVVLRIMCAWHVISMQLLKYFKYLWRGFHQPDQRFRFSVLTAEQIENQNLYTQACKKNNDKAKIINIYSQCTILGDNTICLSFFRT